MKGSCECGNELASSINGRYFLTSGRCVSSRKVHAPELLRHVYVSCVSIFKEYFLPAVAPILLTAQSGSMAGMPV